MELFNLKPAKGATFSKKRIARGQGSGLGNKSTRGSNGDGSRSGHKNKRNHEGGQTPLQMRLPKIGFKNINRVTYETLSLAAIQRIATQLGVSDISLETLVNNKIVKRSDKVKILGGGELAAKLNITVHAISESAKAVIESLGGSVNLVK